jgi:CheY-like chemotaxis protein
MMPNNFITAGLSITRQHPSPGNRVENKSVKPRAEVERSHVPDLQSQKEAGDKMALIVGYEQALRSGLEELLEISGIPVTTARSGEEAIQNLTTNLKQVKVVLLDTHLAGMNAVATFDALYEIKPSLHVILCSSFEPKEIARQFTNRSITAYLRKPFDIEFLLQYLYELLR